MFDRCHAIVEGFSFDALPAGFERHLFEYGVGHRWNPKLKLKIGVLTLTFPTPTIMHIRGSIQKSATGNNYGDFTYSEAIWHLQCLSEFIGVPLDRFRITSLELGINLAVRYDPRCYWDMFNRYGKNRYILLAPLKNTYQPHGRKCYYCDYEIKVYDKTFESSHSSQEPREVAKAVPKNLVRFEVRFKSKALKRLGWGTVTGATLLDEGFKAQLLTQMENMFESTVFNKLPGDCSKLTMEQMQKVTFALSEDYDRYLAAVKEAYPSRYAKELANRRMTLKHYLPLINNKYERELRRKFHAKLPKLSA